MSDRDRRLLPVPDGLAGMRLDQAISRLFGLSRTVAASLVEDGDVLVDGAVRAKSEKLGAGAWLEEPLPAPPRPADAEIMAEPVDGLALTNYDHDIHVADKT